MHKGMFEKSNLLLTLAVRNRVYTDNNFILNGNMYYEIKAMLTVFQRKLTCVSQQNCSLAACKEAA